MINTPVSYVSHLNNLNQINAEYGKNSLMIIFSIIFILIIANISGKDETDLLKNKNDAFSYGSSTILRGMAILLLCIGHFAIKCIEGVLPFEYAGEYAVIIFVMLSGIGLTKKYDISNIPKTFLFSRIKKLIIPVWLCLILFYILDFLLTDRTHTLYKIILSFLGVINSDPPNGPDWFISYIIFLYMNFYIVSSLSITKLNKIIVLLAISYGMMFFVHYFPDLKYVNMWVKYSIVFPVAVLIGLYRDVFFKWMDKVRKFSIVIFYALMAFFFVCYLIKLGLQPLTALFSSELVSEIIISVRPVYLIIFVVMLAYEIDRFKYYSRFLKFLGDYSMEIFLLHMPFMVYYDFLLFRKPLFIYFFIYCLFIIIMAFLLKKIVFKMNNILALYGVPNIKSH